MIYTGNIIKRWGQDIFFSQKKQKQKEACFTAKKKIKDHLKPATSLLKSFRFDIFHRSMSNSDLGHIVQIEGYKTPEKEITQK